MNISSINSSAAPGTTPRPVAVQASTAEVRQAHATQISSAASVQTAQSVTQTQKTEANRQELEDAVKQVNDFLKPINNAIQFNLDDDTGKTIVKVIDVATKEVIRQFPSEDMLSIAKAIDKMKGLLVQQKA
ncbi:flagellar protein FlaG [Dechloromonas sp. A34]|uniref:flagellar protein FlaG n=1 Tax=Dechloromonas sp. A34 TaxID=447588 RepID=UPI002248D2F8|nr:flagellar protein FlaG [Dechloromonas sp. A34]